MVGRFLNKKSFIRTVNLKREQALRENNLLAIGLMQDKSQMAVIQGCYFIDYSILATEKMKKEIELFKQTIRFKINSSLSLVGKLKE